MVPVGYILIAGFVTLLVYGLHPIKRWQMRKLPGPMPLPFIGNLHKVLGEGIHKVWPKWNELYGPVYQVWWGATPAAIVTDHQAARLILLKNVQRFALPGPAEIQTGVQAETQKVGLASCNDKDLHRDIKNAWLPMFNSASLEASNALINRCAEHLCVNLAVYARKGKETNIWRDFGRMTMDVVGTVAFGVSFHTQERDDANANTEEAQRLIDAAAKIFSRSPFASNVYVGLIVMMPFLAPLLKHVAKRFPSPASREMAAARKLLDQTTLKLVKQARAQQKAGENTGVGAAALVADSTAAPAAAERAAAPDQAVSRKKTRAVQPGSFMLQLMSARHTGGGEPFSDVTVLAQAFTFLLAGYETTATSLGFAVYCLGAHPEKAAKLAEEVDREAASGHVTAEQLARMPYTDACLKESMRLFPPAVMVSRQLSEATSVGGHVLPKGLGVMVPIIEIHRDPAVYAAPHEFLPERWLEGTPEHAADQHTPGSWMTFGEGMRVCVGQRLAVNEAKITLAHIFRRFTFKLSPGQVPLEVECPLLLKPKHGVFVTPVLRNEE